MYIVKIEYRKFLKLCDSNCYKLKLIISIYNNTIQVLSLAYLINYK